MTDVEDWYFHKSGQVILVLTNTCTAQRPETTSEGDQRKFFRNQILFDEVTFKPIDLMSYLALQNFGFRPFENV